MNTSSIRRDLEAGQPRVTLNSKSTVGDLIEQLESVASRMGRAANINVVIHIAVEGE